MSAPMGHPEFRPVVAYGNRPALRHQETNRTVWVAATPCLSRRKALRVAQQWSRFFNQVGSERGVVERTLGRGYATYSFWPRVRNT